VSDVCCAFRHYASSPLSVSQDLTGFVNNIKSVLCAHLAKGRLVGTVPDWVLSSTKYSNTVFVALEDDDDDDESSASNANSFSTIASGFVQQAAKKGLNLQISTEAVQSSGNNDRREAAPNNMFVNLKKKQMKYLASNNFRTIAYLPSSENPKSDAGCLEKELRGLLSMLRELDRKQKKHDQVSKPPSTEQEASRRPLLCIICNNPVRTAVEAFLHSAKWNVAHVLEVVFCCLSDSTEEIDDLTYDPDSAPNSAVASGSRLNSARSNISFLSPAHSVSGESVHTPQSLAGLTISFPDHHDGSQKHGDLGLSARSNSSDKDFASAFTCYKLEDVVRYHSISESQREQLYYVSCQKFSTDLSSARLSGRESARKSIESITVDARAALVASNEEDTPPSIVSSIGGSGVHAPALSSGKMSVVGPSGVASRSLPPSSWMGQGPEAKDRSSIGANSYSDLPRFGVYETTQVGVALAAKLPSPGRAPSPSSMNPFIPPLAPGSAKANAPLSIGKGTSGLMTSSVPLSPTPGSPSTVGLAKSGQSSPQSQNLLMSSSKSRPKLLTTGQVEASIDLLCLSVATHFKNLIIWADQAEGADDGLLNPLNPSVSGASVSGYYGSGINSSTNSARSGSFGSGRDSNSERKLQINMAPNGVIYVRSGNLVTGETGTSRAELDAAECLLTLMIDVQNKIFTSTITGMVAELVDRRFR
jgi:hypothetical protein